MMAIRTTHFTIIIPNDVSLTAASCVDFSVRKFIGEEKEVIPIFTLRNGYLPSMHLKHCDSIFA